MRIVGPTCGPILSKYNHAHADGIPGVRGAFVVCQWELASSQRSASIAAMHPEPAAVMACL